MYFLKQSFNGIIFKKNFLGDAGTNLLQLIMHPT